MTRKIVLLLAALPMVPAACSAPSSEAPSSEAAASASPTEAGAAPASDREADGPATSAPGPRTVRLTGAESGDNRYLTLVRAGRTEEETVLCTAPECLAWAADGLPDRLKGRDVEATFGRADRVDGSGTVMERGVSAVIALRLPDFGGQAGPLPLTRGVYSRDGSPCRQPANAAVRIWNGRGLSGSATRACRSTVTERSGTSYQLRNSCENTYDGSRTSEALTVNIPNPSRFKLGDAGYRLCPPAEVPAGMRAIAEG